MPDSTKCADALQRQDRALEERAMEVLAEVRSDMLTARKLPEWRQDRPSRCLCGRRWRGCIRER